MQVQYAGTAELAATLLAEGGNTPADLFFAQDAGALGAVACEGMFSALQESVLDRVDGRFRSPDDVWVGISGRARVVAYNRDAVSEDDIPESILDFTEPVWDGQLGWAPTNGSFQAFVTALRVLEGEDTAREWLESINANGTATYSGNTQVVQAEIDGEIDAGFVNHYYLYRFEEEAGGEVDAANYWYSDGGPGALINVAGAGIIDGAEHRDEAIQLPCGVQLQSSQPSYMSIDPGTRVRVRCNRARLAAYGEDARVALTRPTGFGGMHIDSPFELSDGPFAYAPGD